MKLLKRGHKAANTLYQGTSSIIFAKLSCTTHPADREITAIFLAPLASASQNQHPNDPLHTGTDRQGSSAGRENERSLARHIKFVWEVRMYHCAYLGGQHQKASLILPQFILKIKEWSFRIVVGCTEQEKLCINTSQQLSAMLLKLRPKPEKEGDDVPSLPCLITTLQVKLEAKTSLKRWCDEHLLKKRDCSGETVCDHYKFGMTIPLTSSLGKNDQDLFFWGGFAYLGAGEWHLVNSSEPQPCIPPLMVWLSMNPLRQANTTPRAPKGKDSSFLESQRGSEICFLTILICFFLTILTFLGESWHATKLVASSW